VVQAVALLVLPVQEQVQEPLIKEQMVAQRTMPMLATLQAVAVEVLAQPHLAEPQAQEHPLPLLALLSQERLAAMVKEQATLLAQVIQVVLILVAVEMVL
jgi:hypothetical protein